MSDRHRWAMLVGRALLACAVGAALSAQAVAAEAPGAEVGPFDKLGAGDVAEPAPGEAPHAPADASPAQRELTPEEQAQLAEAETIKAQVDELYHRGRYAEAEAEHLEALYSKLSRHDFSSELLEAMPHRIAVLELSGVLWSDWGRADRVLGGLSAMNRLSAARRSCAATA